MLKDSSRASVRWKITHLTAVAMMKLRNPPLKLKGPTRDHDEC